MDKKFVCPCGLICSDCLFYRNDIYDGAVKLRQAIEDSHLDVFLSILSRKEPVKAMADHLGDDENRIEGYFEVFRKMPDFLGVLDGIINLRCEKTCRESGGCSLGGITKECDAVKCVKSKGLDGCWECPGHENCTRLKFVKMSYGETIGGNFKRINEKGIESVESRGNNYYEWQRRLNGKK